MENFNFTPENLLENIDKLGAWSSYGLAQHALDHYFPGEYDEWGWCGIDREVELLEKLDCKGWQDVIIKYHKEVGYSEGVLSNKLFVNEY